MKEDSNENKHRENREKALWLATKTMHIARQKGMLRYFVHVKALCTYLISHCFHCCTCEWKNFHGKFLK